MAKITITRIGQEKTINYINKKTGQPDSFQKVGVQTNEYGDKWLDITFRETMPVKVGQSYEAEISEREYNGKTYYDAKLPRENRAGGVSDEQYKALMREVQAIRTEIKMVRGLVDPAAHLTSEGKPVPDFTPRTMSVPKDEDPFASDPDFDPFAGR